MWYYAFLPLAGWSVLLLVSVGMWFAVTKRCNIQTISASFVYVVTVALGNIVFGAGYYVINYVRLQLILHSQALTTVVFRNLVFTIVNALLVLILFLALYTQYLAVPRVVLHRFFKDKFTVQEIRSATRHTFELYLLVLFLLLLFMWFKLITVLDAPFPVRP